MSKLLEIDPAGYRSAFGNDPFAITHNLVDHPLLTVERVAQLADALPEASVEHNIGDLPLVAGESAAQRAEAKPGEIVRKIDTYRTWMVLKNVEQDPAYRGLLDELLDEVAPLVGDAEGGMEGREAFIFISAPGSITPSHVDPEHNFLLQIRGTKAMNVGTFDDPQDEQRELERVYAGGHRNIEQLPDSVECFDLAPGDGVYVRPDAPHFVQNGPDVSISLSITWRTAITRRTGRVHRLNKRLRTLKLVPAAPGQRPQVDRVKEVVARADAGVEKVVSRLRRAA
jgi:hypothetical protein